MAFIYSQPFISNFCRMERAGLQTEFCLFVTGEATYAEKTIQRYSDDWGNQRIMAKGRKTTLEERIEIISYCIANHRDYAAAMRQFDVTYYQVYGWLRKYEAEGPAGLLDRRGRRKDVLPVSELAQLSERRSAAGRSDVLVLAQPAMMQAAHLRLHIQDELLKELQK